MKGGNGKVGINFPKPCTGLTSPSSKQTRPLTITNSGTPCTTIPWKIKLKLTQNIIKKFTFH